MIDSTTTTSSQQIDYSYPDKNAPHFKWRLFWWRIKFWFRCRKIDLRWLILHHR